MYVAVKIHNNKLGAVVECEHGEEEAMITVKLWAEDQLKRELTKEELESLENDWEVCNEDDADNIWCYSVGTTEW